MLQRFHTQRGAENAVACKSRTRWWTKQPRSERCMSCRSAAASQDENLAHERLLAAPRIEDGLDVHRRIHVRAARHAVYLFQWRAFCDRQRRSWQEASTGEDEDVLAAFHFELERSVRRFEADVKAGREHTWPARCMHPTQGLMTLGAVFRAATEATLGRTNLFRHE